MYRSVLDGAPQELAFEFDPLRPVHAHDGSQLQWPEYPYKQVVIDKVCAKYTSPKLSDEAAAGALLIGRGDVTRAMFEVDQHFDHDNPSDPTFGNPGWSVLVARFRDERDAFLRAKREFIKSEKMKVAAKLQGIADEKQAEADRIAKEEWRKRQIIKRYDNGSKYDGDGVYVDGVAIPHGHGTLWVPQRELLIAGDVGDIKRVPRYIGEWKDGLMHGRGTYRWQNGDTWAGTFCRDELHGKGIFTLGSGDTGFDDVDTGRPTEPKVHRVRYFESSKHVCWGDELMRGCRLRLFENRWYGRPTATAVTRHDVQIEDEVEWTIVDYDAKKDQYLLRKGETERTKWVSLENTNFRLVPSRQLGRYEPGD